MPSGLITVRGGKMDYPDELWTRFVWAGLKIDLIENGPITLDPFSIRSGPDPDWIPRDPYIFFSTFFS